MAKVDLRKSAGFSLYLDDYQLTTQDMQFEEVGKVEIDQIRPQLLNEELTSPEVFYYKYMGLDHDNIFKTKGLKVNIYVIPANFAGIEFVKTRATRLPTHPKIMEVIYGTGSVIMQKFHQDDSDIIYSKIKREQKFIVPPGYDVTLVNTRNTAMIVVEAYSSVTKHVSQLDSMQGMAYYVIRKNAKQEVVQNPRYRDITKVRKIRWDEVVVKNNITLKTPIVKQILRKYDKFDWLFKENSIKV
ncbi:MAG: glucose-6-phosphate isomerase family protein [Candidatus Dojkabacteria bacterium]|nr:MAG: glucose-6-phosphate isomerase family protein [Candidatus Dojkabacteria bacterium]